MTNDERQQLMAEATRLNFHVSPIQVGEEIRVLVQIGDIAGMAFTLSLTQDAARALSKVIKDGVQRAEVTLVKPTSAIATA